MARSAGVTVALEPVHSRIVDHAADCALPPHMLETVARLSFPKAMRMSSTPELRRAGRAGHENIVASSMPDRRLKNTMT